MQRTLISAGQTALRSSARIPTSTPSLYRAALRNTSIRLSSSSSSGNSSSSSSRTLQYSLIASIAAAALIGTTQSLHADSSVNPNKEQREDPDHVPSGAKIGAGGEVSEYDPLEDVRAAGFKVDSKAEGKDKYITLEEVAQHNLAVDNWVVVEGKVYDVSHFTKYHPGGAAIIVANAGRDVTDLFKPIHPPNTLENNLPPESFKGLVDPVDAAKSVAAFKAEQDRIEQGRNSLAPAETMLSIDELEDAAKSFLSPRVSNYYSAAALDGVSLDDNKAAFRKCRLLPRVMRDVASIEPQTTIFGEPSALPIYVAPASNALMGHPDGELNITRGASKTGIVQGVSAAASYSLTDILAEKEKMDEETGRKMGLAYQVYFQLDRSRTEELVREAVDAGVSALLLTVDSNVLDYRQSTEKIKGTREDAEPGVRMKPFTEFDQYHDAHQCWADLPWLKDLAKGTPIYLKGVCHIDDVRLAREHGLAGVILSNHGGRQLDRARSAFDSLRSIHAQDPQLLKDIEVYVDGGARRGTDVLQAIAFGARGVGLGRPFLYAQSAYGEKGVVRAVRIMEQEIITAMRLLGVNKISDIKPEMVECLQELWK